MAKENVNHPAHYNQHPAGIECIEIIRHYTFDIANAIKYLWRAGLKTEMSMSDAEKEIEDLYKALWYIADYLTMCATQGVQHYPLGCSASVVLFKLTGHGIDDVTKGYDQNVSIAMEGLLRIGIISLHTVYAVDEWKYWLNRSQQAIIKRIDEIEEQISKTTNKTLEEEGLQLIAME